MKLINSRYLFFILLILALSLNNHTIFAQSSDPENEYIKADALAMAYATCDFDLTNYYFGLDKNNIEIKRELEKASLTKSVLSISMAIKYQNDERLKQKYQRAIEPAKKKLGKCIKFQSIMDSKAKDEKEKEKEDPNK